VETRREGGRGENHGCGNEKNVKKYSSEKPSTCTTPLKEKFKYAHTGAFPLEERGGKKRALQWRDLINSRNCSGESLHELLSLKEKNRVLHRRIENPKEDRTVNGGRAYSWECLVLIWGG